MLPLLAAAPAGDVPWGGFGFAPPAAPADRYVGWRVRVRQEPRPAPRLGRPTHAVAPGIAIAFVVTVRTFDRHVGREVAMPYDALAAAAVRAFWGGAPDAVSALGAGLMVTPDLLPSGELLVAFAGVATAGLRARIGRRIWLVIEQPGDWRTETGFVVVDAGPAEP